MHPILFKIGPLNIYSYGVMVALGFGVMTAFIYFRAPKFNLDRDSIIDFSIIVLISGVIGARLLYVLLNFRYYLVNPLEVFNFSRGGLAWYGGFVMALLASVWYVKKKKLDFWASSDFIAPYIALAQGFGRIGCFLNGCCYGIEAPAGFPLGLALPHDALRHPAQLYSASLLFAIFVILRVWQDKKRFDGEIFLGYCILYSIKRFSVEFLRGDNPRILLGLTLSQVISVFLLAVALLLFISRYRRWKKKISTGSK